MKKIDIGQTITILANVGVIAGIVFLAFELRQNNSLLAAQASFSRLSIATERRARLLEELRRESESGGLWLLNRLSEAVRTCPINGEEIRQLFDALGERKEELAPLQARKARLRGP